MNRLRQPSTALAAVGVALFLVALTHHAREVGRLGVVAGPFVAFALDGVPALGLVYAARRLADTPLERERGWVVVVWTVTGAALFVAVIALSVVVRVSEGRPPAEPVFVLLLSAGAGGLAGCVAGYHRAGAVVDKRRAERTAQGLSLVNSILRHDLRNDLQVVGSTAELVASDADGETADRAARVSRRAADAQDRLDDTEAVARSLAGEVTAREVDLAATVRSATAGLGETYGATVGTDLPETARVLADEGVRSVVDNLVQNAAEHSDAEEPRVDVAVERRGDTVRLRVRDNGPGLPEGARATLQGEGEGSAAGGLGIVRALVEQYGGRVAVVDRDPRGTEVVVDLPAA